MTTTANKIRVAVHRVPYITNAGYTCNKWHEYIVYAGAQPYGPRGGYGGRVVAAERIGGRYRTRGEAEAVAARFAARTGAALIGL